MRWVERRLTKSPHYTAPTFPISQFSQLESGNYLFYLQHFGPDTPGGRIRSPGQQFRPSWVGSWISMSDAVLDQTDPSLSKSSRYSCFGTHNDRASYRVNDFWVGSGQNFRPGSNAAPRGMHSQARNPCRRLQMTLCATCNYIVAQLSLTVVTSLNEKRKKC